MSLSLAVRPDWKDESETADRALEAFRRDAISARALLSGEILEPGAAGTDIVFSPSPFSARASRYEMPAGGTIEDAIDLAGIGRRIRSHLSVYVGDALIEREAWALTRPKPGSVIYIRATPQGGGGKGKNPLRAILTLALVVVATVTGGAAAALFGGATTWTGAAVGVVASAAVLTAGQALINALVPPPSVKDQWAFDQQPGNPYGSIMGLANRAVPYGPIPRVIGKRRIYPMLAARPYTESQGNTQYLRMLLMAGYGPLRITDLRIGSTPLSAFSDVQTEIREGWESDDPVTLYTKQIEEEPLSIELTQNVSNVRTTESGATEVSLDIVFPQGLATFDDKGNPKTRTVNFTVKYRLNGSGGSWINAAWIDGKSEYGTATNGQIQAKAASVQTVIKSGRFAVPAAGAYDVQVIRTTAAGGSKDSDRSFWTVLRSIRPGVSVNMPGITLIALRMKATGQLNGSPDTINCLAESYLPVWDDEEEEWNWEISRSPAWAYVDVLRRRGTTYLFDESRFPLTKMVEWATECATTAPNASEPTHVFDGVFEGGSIFSAAQAIAAQARAQFTLIDGKFDVVRDVAQSVPRQHITPRNSWGYRGSKAFIDLPHAFRVTFINPNQDYSQDEVIVYRDEYNEDGSGGKIAASKFETLDLPHCTSSTAAWRAGRYHLAQILLRPEEHSVWMDIEHLRVTKGDLVRFSHDVISIGLGHGRVLGRQLNEANTHVTHLILDSPVDMASGKTYGVRIRLATGASSLHALVTEVGADLDLVELVTPAAIATAPKAGDLFQFGETDLESAPMLIKAIAPGPDLTAQITLVDAQPGVWTADGGTIPAFNTYITRTVPSDQDQPQAPSFALRSDGTAAQRFSDGTLIERIEVRLVPPSPSDVMPTQWEVGWRLSDADQDDWVRVGPMPIAQLSAFLFPVVAGDEYDIRARTISAHGVASDWTTSTGYEVEGLSDIPPDVTGFTATPGAESVELSWNGVADPDLSFYRIKRGPNWADGVIIAEVAGERVLVKLEFGETTTFWIAAVNKVGAESQNPASVSAAQDDSGLALALTDTFNTAWEAIQGLQLRELQLQTYLADLGLVNGISLGATITNIETSYQEGDALIAETIALIGAKTLDGTAFVLDGTTVKVSPTETLAGRLTTMSAATAAAAAAVSTETSARVAGDSANAASIASVSTSLGGLSATVSSYASSTNGLLLRYGVRLDSNGYVSGFLANNDGTTSDFIILSNKFALVDPTGGPGQTPSVPFEYSGGVVRIKEAYIPDLTSRQITISSGGRIKYLGGSKQLVEGCGFGASSDLILWYGPNSTDVSAMTKTNGHFAMATDGKVYYGSADLDSLGGGALSVSMSGSAGGTRSGSGVITSGVLTVSASGGSGPYTYEWGVSFGSGEGRLYGFSAPTSNSTTMSAYVGLGQNYDGRGLCRVRDANGKTGTAYFGFAFSEIS